MKHRMFNVRNLIRNPQTVQHTQENKPSSTETEQKTLSPEFSELLSILKGLVTTNNNTNIPLPNPKQAYQVEARDREVLLQTPPVIDGNMSPHSLKLWVSNVVKTVSSSAFHSFSKGDMSFEQAKIYCSENIFKNIVLLCKKQQLSPADMKMIDQHIKKGVLSYLSAKYPLTDSSEVNKKLESVVHQVDNIQAIPNNYLNDVKVVFQFRQSANYNDLIMEAINQITGKIDQPAYEETSNYQDFENFMSSLFEKVEDIDWMRGQEKQRLQESPNKGKSEISQDLDGITNMDEVKEALKKRNEEREKYKIKVKEYTHYRIGRKIKENTPKFTEYEIENGNIVIKSPQILRILTKWCEQLQEKYHNSYYCNRSESVKLQRGGHINGLIAWMREDIDKYLSKTNKEIEQSLSELLENNYEMQAKILQNELERQGLELVDQIERVTGKFSYKIQKNLHTYLITYLNQLIHGLLTAARDFFKENNYGKGTYWPYPPNLLTFKIGDLMRCKVASKQAEILKIYQEIQRISKDNPEKLKIVRIKNRLKSGTNDILMNLRFNDQILCEVQLAIETKTSDFIKCSNMFHHYIYELERSIFGPLTELCSIWNTLDRRTNIYQQLVQREQEQIMKLKEHSCLQLGRKFKTEPYEKTFICSKCQHTYYHNRFPKKHLKCSTCSYLICARCQIDEETKVSPQCLFDQQEEISKHCGKRVPKEAPLPKVGICIFIQSKTPKIEHFNYLTYLDNDYLLAKKDKQIYEICPIKTNKDKEKFRKEYQIFQLSLAKNFISISLQQGLKRYILPQIMKLNYKKQKETVSLMKMNLNTQECRYILSIGTKTQKENIKNIFLSNNNLKSIPFDPLQFPNIVWISLSGNARGDINGFQLLKNLKKISLALCQLSAIPPVIYQCAAIEELLVSMNHFTNIQDKISSLKHLRVIELYQNKLTSLPQGLFQCTNLRLLNFSQNSITQISQNIRNLQFLEILNASLNQIASLPEGMGELRVLKQLNFKKNPKLEKMPASFGCLSNLESFDISQTKIGNIPASQVGFPKLKYINLQKSQVKQFSSAFKCSTNIQTANFNYSQNINLDNFYADNLTELQMAVVKAQTIPFSMCNMRLLKTLNLTNSEIKDFGKFFEGLQQIETLNMTSCKLEVFPNLSKCKSMKSLKVTKNNVSEISTQSLGGLVNLQTLAINYTSITSFPPTLAKLRKLVRFQAYQNKLTSLIAPAAESALDASRCYWPNLTKVYLGFNALTQVPLLLCNCEKIQYLSLSQNKIENIRPEISNMIGLKELSIGKNPIKDIPQLLAELPKLSQLSCENSQITRIPKYLETFTSLKKLEVTAANIVEIECIDWILASKDINFGKLKDIAKELKEKCLKENTKLETK